MRILWVGDAPTVPSAYGGQAALFIPRLRAAGYDVALLATGGSAGSTYRTADGLTVYPTVGDPRGNDIVALHAKAHRADLVLTLGDAHAFAPDVYKDLPWLAWAPLDFETPTQATLRALKHARWIWSPSVHGRNAYKSVGLGRVGALQGERYVTGISHVPHGVDSKVFVLANDRAAIRHRVLPNVPADAFLIVVVGANKGTPARKGWFEIFSAFKIFADTYPKALLYVHTEISGIAGGENLHEIEDLVGLDRGRVIFPPQYEYLCGGILPSTLAGVYNAADVFLSASHGEGFGLPAYEAQLCGTPTIMPRNTAQTEACLSSMTGHLLDTTPYMPFDGASLWCRPSVPRIVEALEAVRARALLGWGNDRAQTRAKATAFDVDRIFREYMSPELDKIAKEIR